MAMLDMKERKQKRTKPFEAGPWYWHTSITTTASHWPKPKSQGQPDSRGEDTNYLFHENCKAQIQGEEEN